MFSLDVNYLAVLVSALIWMVLGYIWYSPKVFGNAWCTQQHVHDEKCEKCCGKSSYFWGFLSALVTSYVLALLVYGIDTYTILEGLELGFILWLGLVATVYLGGVIWERKSWKWWAVHSGYYLVGLLLTTALLSVWA